MLFELQSKRHNGRDRKYRRDYLNKFYLRQQKTSTKQHMLFDYLSLSSQIMSKTQLPNTILASEGLLKTAFSTDEKSPHSFAAVSI